MSLSYKFHMTKINTFVYEQIRKVEEKRKVSFNITET